VLLDHGVNAESPDGYGCLVLIYAVRNGHDKVVRALVLARKTAIDIEDR
jgi:hypothetical protein